MEIFEKRTRCSDSSGGLFYRQGDGPSRLSLMNVSFRVFWHKLMRKAFTSHAAFLIHHILGMPRGTGLARHAIVLIAFLVSGVMHAMVPPVSLCEGVWQMAYYSCVGITIAAENVLGQVFRHYQASCTGPKKAGRSACWRVAGYLWVAFFHLWTTATFDYPSIICTGRSLPG